jgi:outer membrane protein assembly factor BamB
MAPVRLTLPGLVALVSLTSTTAYAQSQPDSNTGRITGHVVTAYADLLNDVTVTLARINDQGVSFRARTTRSDIDGAFSFSQVPPGRYRLQASKPGYTSRQFEVITNSAIDALNAGPAIDLAPDTQVDVQILLRRTASIAGRILRPDGSAAANVRVEAAIRSGNRRLPLFGITTTSQADGRYELTNLPPGDYLVGAMSVALPTRQQFDAIKNSQAARDAVFAATAVARTGSKVWTFHTIPRPGEAGHETWGNDSWRDRTGNNVWSFTLTVDEQRGLVYMPVSGPGMNYYGGDRPGNNLFSNTTVALDAQTGRLKWHFQNIRHEIWDYNLPPAAGLVDIRKDGKTIPALAQVGKSGFMFILNREDGTPVHGVDERPQAKADVPGEWYPATQPIPKKPGPLARVNMTRNDLVTAEDTTPAHAEACRALWDKVQFRNDGPYTPWNYRPSGGPPSIAFPGMTGGVNWGGTATDPTLGYIFVNSKDEPSTGWIAPNPRYNETTRDTEFPYVHQSGGMLSAEAHDADGRPLGTLPCFRPPWASLMAVDAATGEFVWRVPLGVNDNMPEGKQNVGSPGYGGPIVTAGGLVFIGATRDRRFRAFDSRTGKELWSTRLDYNVTAIPITYMGKSGKQYVAVTAATQGQGNNESLHVFALP